MKKWTVLFMLALVAGPTLAQKYFTRSGNISFFSSTPVEDIEAHSKSASSVLDSQSGALEFSVPMKSFHFEKALMEEHFNENYVESNKPGNQNATFKGTITNISEVNFKKDGEYAISITGKLTMHGKTQDVKSTGKIKVAGSDVKAKSEFKVVPQDYDIEIPDLVREKIAKDILIKVRCTYQPLKR